MPPKRCKSEDSSESKMRKFMHDQLDQILDAGGLSVAATALNDALARYLGEISEKLSSLSQPTTKERKVARVELGRNLCKLLNDEFPEADTPHETVHELICNIPNLIVNGSSMDDVVRRILRFLDNVDPRPVAEDIYFLIKTFTDQYGWTEADTGRRVPLPSEKGIGRYRVSESHDLLMSEFNPDSDYVNIFPTRQLALKYIASRILLFLDNFPIHEDIEGFSIWINDKSGEKEVVINNEDYVQITVDDYTEFTDQSGTYSWSITEANDDDEANDVDEDDDSED